MRIYLAKYWKALVWISLVTIASLLSSDSLKDAPKINIEGFDKFVHFCMYAGVSFLLMEGFLLKNKKLSSLKFSLYFIGFAILYGTCMEVLQFQMGKGRSAELADFIANSLGAIAGVPAFLWGYKWIPWLRDYKLNKSSSLASKSV
jgi:VanZ family protein